jgi:hypothetical protein
MSSDPVRMLELTLGVLRRERATAPRALAADFRRGARAWRAWYGERIVSRLRRDWREGRRGKAQARAVVALARHAPGLLIAHVLRKLAGIARTALAAAARRVTAGRHQERAAR